MADAQSIEDLIAAIKAHPEWRQRLVTALLGEDFLRLPDRVEQIHAEIAEMRAEEQRRFQSLEQSNASLKASTAELHASHGELREATAELQASYGELRKATAELQASHGELREAIAELQASQRELQASQRELQASQRELQVSQRELQAAVAELARGLNKTVKRLDGLQGQLRGEKYERQKRRGAFYVFRGGESALSLVEARVQRAVIDEALSAKQAEDLMLLDLLWMKRLQMEPEPAWVFACEISVVVDRKDIGRAKRRAEMVERLLGAGYRVLPTVLGERFAAEELEAEARGLGVAWILEEDERTYSDEMRPLVRARPA